MRWHGGGVAAIAAVVAVALAGCGKPASAGATPSSKASNEQAMLQFTRCMRDHGANVQDAKANAGGGMAFQIQGGDKGPLDAAMQACQKYMPKAGGPPPDPAEMQKAFDRALKFSQCMRQHGVDMPDPKQESGGISISQQGPGGVDPQSKQFQDAQKACEQFFGPPGGKGGQGPSTQIQGGPGGKDGGSGAVISGNG
jgi:hypothetical protein